MMKGKGASGFLKQVVSLVMSVVKAKSMAVKSKTSAFKTRLIVFGLLRNKKVLMTAVSHKIHALLGAGHDDHHQQHVDEQYLDRSGSGAGAADDDGDDSKAVVLYSAVPNEEAAAAAAAGDDDDPEAAASAETSTLINSLARWRHLIPYHGDFGMIESTGTANLVNNINGADVGAAAAEEEEEEEEEEEDDDGYPDLRHSLFDEEEEWYLRGDDGTGSVVDLVMRNMIRGEEEDGGREFVLEDEIDHVADVFIRRFHRQMRMQKLDSFKRFQEMMERSV